MRQAIEESNNKDALKEFEDIEKALNDRGLIDKQVSRNFFFLWKRQGKRAGGSPDGK